MLALMRRKSYAIYRNKAARPGAGNTMSEPDRNPPIEEAGMAFNKAKAIGVINQAPAAFLRTGISQEEMA